MKKLFTILLLLAAFISNAQNTLDNIGLTNATPASVAYSLRQLSTSYTGPLVRIKVGTSFYDVYPDASTKKFSLSSKISAAVSPYNTAVAAAGASALSTIISGSTDATVAIWYDQSGNGVDVLSSSATAKIITAGSILTMSGQPTINFHNSTSYLKSSSNVNYGSQSWATVNAVAQNVACVDGISGIISVGGLGDGAGFSWGLNFDPGTWLSGYWVDGSGITGALSGVNSTDPKVVTALIQQDAFSSIYVNSTLKGTKATNDHRFDPTDVVFVGARGTYAGRYFIGNIAETMIFPKNLSSTEQAALESSQSQFLPQPVTITSSASGAVCAGTNVTFTAVPSNISTPTYQWYKNGTAINGATSSTYSTTTLSNNDQVNVIATPGYTSGSISSAGLIANFDAANYNTASTRWNDLSTSGNHMDFYSSYNYSTLKTATYSTDGGGSLNVNNNSVYGRTISNTGISGNGGKTMSAWVKFDAADRDWTDIANFGSFGGWAQLFELFGSRNGTGYQIMLVYSGSVVAGATTIPLNTWSYITISADGPSLKVYVNGNLDASATQNLSTVNSPLYLGNSEPTSNFDNLRGKISTLSLYNAALTSQTILDNYNATKGRYTTTSVSSNTITTTINASPTAPTISVTGDACANKTTLTTTSGLTAYAWYKDNVIINGATSNTYTPTAIGAYQVQVTSGSCSSTSTSTTIYACAVSSSGQMVATSYASSIISPEGGANFGTGRDFSGKLYNTVGLTTTKGTIGSSTAILGGVISPTNSVTSSIGLVYSTDVNFGTSSSTTIQSNVAAGTYSSSITGLSSTTTYYAKSFIVNKAGTSYGNVVSFTTAAAPVTVGSVYGGGIVFYILQSGDNGYDANVQHGLIAQPQNEIDGLSSNPPFAGNTWTNVALNSNTISGAQNDGTLIGRANTAAIIADQGPGTYLFKYVSTLSINGYTDWYVPSIRELNLFRDYAHNTTYCTINASTHYYWASKTNSNYKWTWGTYISSTQASSNYKTNYIESNGIGNASYNISQSGNNYVYLAIRSF
jgi:hypothetical protein